MSIAAQEYSLDMDVNNMCRICLSQTDTSERLFSLFSSAIVDGFLVSLPDVIEFSVDLRVYECDGMPGKICHKCKAQLLNFYLFKQKCKRTEKILQDTFSSETQESFTHSNSEEETDEKYPNSSDGMIEIHVDEQDLDEVVTDELTSSNIIPLTEKFSSLCEVCDQLFSTEDELQKHTAVHCKTTTVQFEEVECTDERHLKEFDISEKNVLVSTVAKKLVDMINSAPNSNTYCVNGKDQEVLASDDRFLNDQEDTASNIIDDNELQSPQGDETSNINIVQLRCNVCGKTVKGRSCYLKHLRIHDANTSVTEFFSYHICRICSMVFLDGSELSEHINVTNHQQVTNDYLENSATKYICGICSAENKKIVQMKQHLLSHMNSFPCPFEGCGCEYTSSARLGIHIANKHIEYESHQCQHCGADSFESMAELQQHVRFQCSGKKFPCDHCDKKFLTSRSLAHHLKCLEKKHRCTECDKTFAQHGELKLHQRMHNGERPFKCTVCGKCYKTASLRTAHMDSHIEGKTFQCHLCGKHLQTRTCYRNHIKRHSEERKHECDVCSKKFYTKYNVKVHKEKVHKLNQQK